MTKENPGYNPYLAAKSEWMERYGSYISQASQWRIIALVCLLITILSISGNVIQARQYKVVPYIIQVDSLGKASTIGRADLATPAPRTLVQAELAEAIINWRTVTADLDLQKRMVGRLSHFVTGAAQGQISEWFELNNPYKTAQNGRLIQVEVKGLPLPVSTDSWRIEWTETTRNHRSMYISSTTYEATLKIIIQPPATDDQIMANPGGIYITELAYSKVLASGQPVEEPIGTEEDSK